MSTYNHDYCHGSKTIVHAVIAYLMAAHRVTRRGITEIMGSIFGVSISTGAVCNIAKRVSEASIPVVECIKRYIASATALNIDETGWKDNGKRCYLWTFVALRAVLSSSLFLPAEAQRC
jgi:transposase